MAYDLQVADGSGDVQTVTNWERIWYEGSLNGSYWMDILVDGAGPQAKTDFAKGFTVTIVGPNASDPEFEIEEHEAESGGLLRLVGRGTVTKLLSAPKAPQNTQSSDWSSLDTNGIAGDLLSQQPQLSLNVVDNATVADFRSYDSSDVMEALGRFVTQADQMYHPDWANSEVDVKNMPSSSIATLNEGRDVENVVESDVETETYEKVVVIGKGQGDAQVRASKQSGSYSQGDKVKTITDRTITTDAEAQERADVEFQKWNNPRKTYEFDMVDASFQFTLGDLVTLNAPSIGVDTDLRITRFSRTVDQTGKETLSLQVRSTGLRQAAEDKLSRQSQLAQFSKEDTTYDQGTLYSITYEDIDKTTNSDHAEGQFTLPPWLTNSSQIVEANLIVSRKSLKFDVPSSTDDSLTNAGITNNDSFTNAGITNQSEGTEGNGVFLGPYQDANIQGNFDGNWHTAGNSIGIGSGNYLYHGWFVTWGVVVDWSGGVGDTGQLIVRARDGNGNYYPDSNGIVSEPDPNISTTNDLGYVLNAASPTIKVPRDLSNLDFFLEYKATGYYTNLTENANLNYSYYEDEGHTHPNDYNDATHTNPNDYNDANHSNPISRGVNSPSESSQSFDYIVNGSTAADAATLSVGESSGEIDIKSDLNDPSNDRTNTVEVFPDSGGVTTMVKNIVEIKAYRDE